MKDRVSDRSVAVVFVKLEAPWELEDSLLISSRVSFGNQSVYRELYMMNLKTAPVCNLSHPSNEVVDHACNAIC